MQCNAIAFDRQNQGEINFLQYNLIWSSEDIWLDLKNSLDFLIIMFYFILQNAKILMELKKNGKIKYFAQNHKN